MIEILLCEISNIINQVLKDPQTLRRQCSDNNLIKIVILVSATRVTVIVLVIIVEKAFICPVPGALFTVFFCLQPHKIIISILYRRKYERSIITSLMFFAIEF